MSGVYDVRNFMDGMYDDNFYFNNPVDYLANMSDPWFYNQIRTCDIHLTTGTGQWENSGPTYRLSEILSHKGIQHSLEIGAPKAATTALLEASNARIRHSPVRTILSFAWEVLRKGVPMDAKSAAKEVSNPRATALSLSVTKFTPIPN